jgi:hypothetical protein
MEVLQAQKCMNQYELTLFVRRHCITNKIPFTEIHDSFSVEEKDSAQLIKAVEDFLNTKK